MDINDYVYVNRIALNLIGLYPVNIVRYAFCSLSMFLVLIPQLLQVYRYRHDMDALLETSSVMMSIILAMLKSAVWIVNIKKIQLLIDYMFSDYWELCQSPKTSKYLKEYATYGKYITMGHLIFTGNTLVFFCSIPLVEKLYFFLKGSNSTMNLPLPAAYPRFCYEYPYFELTYVSQVVITSICSVMIIGTDTFVAIALVHSSCHFKVVQKELEDVNTNINCLKNAEGDPRYRTMNLRTVKSQLAKIIRHHQAALRFCDNMESYFSPMLLLQTFASSLIICLVGLTVSTTFTDRATLGKYLSYLVMALFQLLLFCFPGDVLLRQSFAVNNAVYSIRWYDAAVSLKVEVSTLMLRAQRPSFVTAGGFYVMHLENFNAVLSTAVSYFMLFRSMNLEDS